MSKSTAHGCVVHTVEAILQLNATEKVIQWPAVEQAETVSNDFQESYGFPGNMYCI